MHRCITRALAAAGASVALSAVGGTGIGVSAAVSQTLQAVRASAVQASHALAIPGGQLWASRYDGPASGDDGAFSVAVSPAGDVVFVTGDSAGSGTGLDYATVAYSTATGAQLWASRYNGPGNGDDYGQSVAVSPAGDKVFVTGYSTGTSTGTDYATIAYNVTTGTQLWIKRYNGPANSNDSAASVAVSPAGTKCS